MIKAYKGTRDILPPSSTRWNRVESAAREVFRRFRYSEIRTPIIEETALFVRGLGEESDAVGKEMYSFDDHGTPVCLRPENTAGVMRAYVEHRLDQLPGVQKLYYIGPMFRRERPQKGRYRQFFQIGAEAIGSESPLLDAEVIELIITMLHEIGIRDARLLLNSIGSRSGRLAYVEAIQSALRPRIQDLSPDSQRRLETNPLRILDSKVEQDRPLIDALPSILDFLSPEDKEHFTKVREYLDDRNIGYEVTPHLVRGLDYYRRTTFEFTHGALGAQNAICGGGRYDGLAEDIGSKIPAPGIGFSIGEDRLMLAVEEAGLWQPGSAVDVFAAGLDEPSLRQLAVTASSLRRAGLAVEVSSDLRLKKSLELANKLGARFALIVGADELSRGEFQLKNMETGEQKVAREEELVGLIDGTANAA
jgi:histidyl-tRNA synthetase